MSHFDCRGHFLVSLAVVGLFKEPVYEYHSMTLACFPIVTVVFIVSMQYLFLITTEAAESR